MSAPASSCRWVSVLELRQQFDHLDRHSWLELLQTLSRNGHSRLGHHNLPAAHAIAADRGWLTRPTLALPPAAEPPEPAPQADPEPAAPPGPAPGPAQHTLLSEPQFWDLLPASIPSQQRHALLVQLAAAGAFNGSRIALQPALAIAKSLGILSSPPAHTQPSPPPERRPPPESPDANLSPGRYVSPDLFANDLAPFTSQQRAWFKEQLIVENAIRSDGFLHAEIAADLILELIYGTD